nr:uncharacterized protein LOC112275155 [Physcomitrium patens]|eukprot:XP_024361020.1 uncharacterized protein LOC112275155 [Physcomitrella patens]
MGRADEGAGMKVCPSPLLTPLRRRLTTLAPDAATAASRSNAILFPSLVRLCGFEASHISRRLTTPTDCLLHLQSGATPEKQIASARARAPQIASVHARCGLDEGSAASSLRGSDGGVRVGRAAGRRAGQGDEAREGGETEGDGGARG